MARRSDRANAFPAPIEHGSSLEDQQPERDRVAERAYARYEARGRADGQDVQDWLEAEQELRQSSSEPDSSNNAQSFEPPNAD
jgi:hypothetical protein